MANAADCHLRHAESKVGTSVSVPADYFHENYTHNEVFWIGNGSFRQWTCES